MSPASATAEKHVASYQIRLNGAELKPELMNALGEIKIVDSLMLPDSLDLTMFINSYDKVKATQDVDGQPFKIGTELVVKAGALEDQAPMTTVFEGQVVAVDADFGHGGITLGVRAYDLGHKLMRNRKARVFKDQTVSDVVRSILGENGLSADVTSTNTTMDWIQQDNETDWDFIWRLARGLGYWLLIDGKNAQFIPAEAVVKQNTVELEWPTTIASFHPRVSGAQQVQTVTASAWDPKSKRVMSSSADASRELSKIGLTRSKVSEDLGGGAIHISNSSAVAPDEVESLAQATLSRIATAYVEAEAHIPGNPKVKAGVTLKVTGVGEQFSGEYLVGTVRHSLSGGGAFDTFVSTGTSTPSSLAAMTGNGNSGGNGKFGDRLVIGLVSNNKDDEKLGRVKVKFPALDDTLESDWLRIATLNAGPQRGVLMLPQVNDEVIVGFENGDTRRGYVLGSLWNGKDKPAPEHLKGADENDGSFSVQSDKQFIATSKDEMKLTSTKKMTIESKDEQLVKIAKDRTEQVGGNLKDDVSGNLEQKAKGNYKSESTGSTTIKATGTVTLESSASLTIKAPSVTVEGQASLTLKAPQVTINGSAMVNISGGLINLG
jgi:phage protein D